MKIPKIIHQVWEGRIDPHISFRLQLLSKTRKEQNPDWEYHLWNGKEMEELVSNHFPEYKDMYNGFSYNVQRWDTIRYMILNKYGGVYTDLDSRFRMFPSYRKIIGKRSDVFWRRTSKP